MNEDLLDDFAYSNNPKERIRHNYRLWWFLVLMGLFLDAALLTLINPDFQWYVLLGNLVAVAIITVPGGLVLGLLASLIPYKHHSYKDKYMRASQFCMVGIILFLAISFSYTMSLWHSKAEDVPVVF